ncbi:MAG TPA: hypothetical protein VFP72_23650 [Kineosporiaceae bacterium]|nr:hypothetical protein [Kineosporiaceae bacterium]
MTGIVALEASVDTPSRPDQPTPTAAPDYPASVADYEWDAGTVARHDVDIAALRAAQRDVERAEEALRKARGVRTAELRARFATVAELGHRETARRIGGISEGTVRLAVQEQSAHLRQQRSGTE